MNERYWNILYNYLGEDNINDQVHGLPHIKRVYDNFMLFCDFNKSFDQDFLNTLEVAVIFHDIGHSRPQNGRHHADISGEILQKLFKKELSDVKEKETVKKLVETHYYYRDRDIKQREDQLYSLLVLFDHMDAIGRDGMFRVVIKHGDNISFFPENHNIDRIRTYLDNPAYITKENQKEMRFNSVLEHITSNYAITYRDYLPHVNSLISDGFKNEINKKLSFSKEFVQKNLV